MARQLHILSFFAIAFWTSLFVSHSSSHEGLYTFALALEVAEDTNADRTVHLDGDVASPSSSKKDDTPSTASSAGEHANNQHQTKINVEGGWLELVTRILEIVRSVLDSTATSSLPSCGKAVSDYVKRTEGNKLRRLQGDLLKATASVTEWQSALTHPRPAAQINMTETEFKYYVQNKTVDAEVLLQTKRNALEAFRNETHGAYVPKMYATCYKEARAASTVSNALIRDAAAAADEKARNADDDDVITDEYDDDSNDASKKKKGSLATGLFHTTKPPSNSLPSRGPSSLVLPPDGYLNPAEDALLAAAPFTTRLQVYAEMHLEVLKVSAAAVGRDAFDRSFLPSWAAFRTFVEGCYSEHGKWWLQATKRAHFAKKLFSGQSIHQHPNEMSEERMIPIAAEGENLHLGSRPGSEHLQKPLDERYGIVSYTGKEEAEKKRKARLEAGLNDPFLWLDLTEAAHVTPENARFTGFLLAAEAILCYAVTFSLFAGAALTVVVSALVLQALFPIVAIYHIAYRLFFGIYFREFFWNFFVTFPAALEKKSIELSTATAGATPSAFAGLGSSADTAPLSLQSFIKMLPSMPSVVLKAVTYDSGASALPVLVIAGAVLFCLTMALTPYALLVWEFIGRNEARARSALHMQGLRARELLAMRDVQRAAAMQQRQQHGHSHGNGVPCNHSH